MTVDEYRQRMIRAFHNTDCDELIALCVLPTEKEFDRLEWLLKNIYKNEPCKHTLSRKKTGHWVHGEYCSECGCDVPGYIIDWKWQKDKDAKYCPNCGAKMESEGE